MHIGRPLEKQTRHPFHHEICENVNIISDLGTVCLIDRALAHAARAGDGGTRWPPLGSSKPQSALIASADAAPNDLCGRSRRSELECLIDSFGMHSADGPRCRCSHVSVGTTQLASASASAARLATYCRIVCVASRQREWLSRMIIIELLNA